MVHVDIPNTQMIFSMNELKNKNFSYYKIGQLVKSGKLKKLNKQFYINTEFVGDESEFCYAYAFVPQGVICLMSAASYYNLTSFRPESIDIAIHRKSNFSNLPEWPIINKHYFSEIRFNTGIKTINENNNIFKIYDIEKTVNDIIYYREQVGIEETKEILISYLKRSDRNINRLVQYSKQLKCYDILNKYLEVLL